MRIKDIGNGIPKTLGRVLLIHKDHIKSVDRVISVGLNALLASGRVHAIIALQVVQR